MSNTEFPVAIAERMLSLGRDLDIAVFTIQAEAKLQAYLDSLAIYTNVGIAHDLRMIERFILQHKYNINEESALKLLNYMHVEVK